MVGSRLVIRGLKVLGALAAVLLAAAAIYRQEQRRGVEELQLLGARVTLDARGDPVWLNLHGGQLNASQMDRVADWSQLNSLVLTGGPVPTQGFAAFSGHSSLRYVDLSYSGSQPETLRIAAAIPNLRELRLRNCTWVDDESLKFLHGARQLSALDLSHTPITDAGLRVLVKLPELQELSLDGCTALTDEGFLGLNSFPALRSVRAVGLSLDRSTYEKLRARRPISLFRIRVRDEQQDAATTRSSRTF
jgi:hypothetical protein